MMSGIINFEVQNFTEQVVCEIWVPEVADSRKLHTVQKVHMEGNYILRSYKAEEKRSG